MIVHTPETVRFYGSAIPSRPLEDLINFSKITKLGSKIHSSVFQNSRATVM